MSKQKLVITGAAGLVGMNLLAMLKGSEKYSITAIDKDKEKLRTFEWLFPGVKAVWADISEKGEWEKEFSGAHSVVQLQAQISATEGRPYQKNNIDTVENVLNACENNNVKHLIHFSSSVVISVAEDNYTNTKKEGEELVKKSKVPYTIIRPPLMYGCFDTKHLGFMDALLDKSPVFPVPGSGKYLRQPLFVEDICKIVIKLLEIKPENKAYDIIGKEKIHFVGLVKIITKEKKQKRLFIPIPIPVFLFLLRCYSWLTGKKPFIPDQLKALTAGDIFPVTNWEDEFDVKYTPFRQGFRKTISSEYYKYKKIFMKKAKH